MKSYPSIPNTVVTSYPIYAFDKIDGSNIRAEWTPKHGFNKFGTRKRLLGPDEKPFGEAIKLIQDNFSEELEKVFRKQRWQKVIAFFEFWGDNSFAGNHEDEPHRVTLIDVNPYKKGILPPKDFVKLFDKVDCARLIYHGKANSDFVYNVKHGLFGDMSPEGVVCKALVKKEIKMFKIKTYAWLNRLKKYCGDNMTLYNKLA